MRKIIVLFVFLLFGLSSFGHPGIGIAMDSKGNVFYTDLVHVWKITPNGEVSIAIENIHTHELYIDQQDNLYGEHEWYEGEATDKWGNYIWKLSSNGIFEKVIPDVEGFLDNNTLIRDNNGNTFWPKKNDDHERLMKDSNNGESCYFTDHLFDDIRWMYYSMDDDYLYVVDNYVNI